jgi:uncharacterized protein involved in exopolysaccharide biosynthesis
MNEEIDLKKIFDKVWKRKYKIALTTFLVTSLAITYAILTPNIYQSQTILLTEEPQKLSTNSLSGLQGMSSFILGNSKISVLDKFNIIFKDDTFIEKIIKKYEILDNLEVEYGLKKYFHNLIGKKPILDQDERYFSAIKKVRKIVSISSDGATDEVIKISAKHQNPEFAKKLVDIFLKELTEHLKKIDMRDLKTKIHFYEKELEENDNIELQTKISDILSNLIQKRVLLNANKLYVVKELVKSQVPSTFEHVAPKRGLIVIMAFLGTIFISLFFAVLID